MKILWVTSGLSTGGAEKMLLKILQGLDAKVFDSIVISLLDEGDIGREIKSLNIPVYSLRINTVAGFLLSFLRLIFFIKKERPDIIQGWMYHGNLAAWLGHFFSFSRSKLIFGIRHTLYDLKNERPLTRVVIRLNSILSRWSNAILFNSELSKHKHEEFGFSSKVLRVIPNGFDLRRFAPDHLLRDQVRSFLAVDNKVVVGMVARYDKAKDHVNFIRAASLIHESFYGSHFILIGRGVCASNEIRSEILKQKMEDHFTLLDQRQDIPQLLNAFDVFCLSSYMEAFPNVIGEAMATGLPCVSTNVGDVEYIIGNTGRVVPVKSPDLLAQAVLEIMSFDIEKKKQLGSAARKRIENSFEISRVVNLYSDFFFELSR